MVEVAPFEYCRLCLRDSFSQKNIFIDLASSGNQIYKVLNYVYGLEICRCDGLSPKICVPCLWRVNEFESCKKNAHQAKEEMLRIIESSKNNSENRPECQVNEAIESKDEAMFQQNEEDVLPKKKQDIGVELNEGTKNSEENTSASDPLIHCENEEVSVPNTFSDRPSDSGAKENEAFHKHGEIDIPEDGQRGSHRRESNTGSISNRPFVCELCGKGFNKFRYLKAHDRKHLRQEIKARNNGNKECFTCKTCGNQYTNRTSLYFHFKKHLEKHSCHPCGRRFYRNADLKRHLQTHTKDS